MRLSREVDDLIVKLYSEYLKNPDDFYFEEETWANLLKEQNIKINKIFDHFYTRLAYLYDQKSVNYEFGDYIANEGFSHWMFTYDDLPDSSGFPAMFWDVYLAFDDGEFHRKEDGSDNPILEHTDPQIRDFLKRNKITK